MEYNNAYLQEEELHLNQEQTNGAGEYSAPPQTRPVHHHQTHPVVEEEELLAAQAAADAAVAQQQQNNPGGVFGNVGQGLVGKNRDMMMQYWQETIDSIEHDEHDFKNHHLPLARIKKVMKTDEDVRMISAEAPILFAKGCDVFITELTMRAWIHAEENKRRTLQKSDIAAALTKSDMFDFLIDVVPREEEKPKKYPTSARTGSYVTAPLHHLHQPPVNMQQLRIPQLAAVPPTQTLPAQAMGGPVSHPQAPEGDSTAPKDDDAHIPPPQLERPDGAPKQEGDYNFEAYPGYDNNY